MAKKFQGTTAPSGSLFMVYRMEIKNGLIHWLRIGRPFKSLQSAITLCDKQRHTAYVEVYPGGKIVYDTLEVA